MLFKISSKNGRWRKIAGSNRAKGVPWIKTLKITSKCINLSKFHRSPNSTTMNYYLLLAELYLQPGWQSPRMVDTNLWCWHPWCPTLTVSAEVRSPPTPASVSVTQHGTPITHHSLVLNIRSLNLALAPW